MRRIVGLVLATVLLVSFSSVAQAGIANSKHDLVNGDGAASQVITGLTAICEPCHTPHATAAQDAPLWNHAATVTTFTAYTTVRNSSSVATGASKLCLGCHDGATALDNYGGAGNSGTKMSASYAIIGAGDLNRNHPIGITYTAIAGNYETIANVTGSGGLRLPGGKIECQSCHDPHSTTVGKFLRKANDTSQLCKTCHLL